MSYIIDWLLTYLFRLSCMERVPGCLEGPPVEGKEATQVQK
jgi:hypothetical protein